VAALVRALDPDGNGAVGRLELSGGLAKLGSPLGGAEADELFDALKGLVPGSHCSFLANSAHPKTHLNSRQCAYLCL
jgi:hypothetical protein